MTSDAVIAAALESLAGMRHAHSDAVQLVPKEPGLYAFYGDDYAWLGASSLGGGLKCDDGGQAAQPEDAVLASHRGSRARRDRRRRGRPHADSERQQPRGDDPRTAPGARDHPAGFVPARL